MKIETLIYQYVTKKIKDWGLEK
jgi:hypothetical protein